MACDEHESGALIVRSYAIVCGQRRGDRAWLNNRAERIVAVAVCEKRIIDAIFIVIAYRLCAVC